MRAVRSGKIQYAGKIDDVQRCTHVTRQRTFTASAGTCKAKAYASAGAQAHATYNYSTTRTSINGVGGYVERRLCGCIHREGAGGI